MLATLWYAFNAEESWLPLLLPGSVWLGGFLYCNLPSSTDRPIFHKWQAFHNIHNLGGIFLALLSLYFDDDAVFNERITILWSLGYFCVDLLDCFWRMDIAFSLHATFCIVLGTGCYTSPVFRLLRINSKALLCELSSPLMHLARKTRDPYHFILFTAVFTLCRVVWLPWFLSDLLHYDLTWYDFRAWFLVLFYGLNLYWWFKMLRIIIYREGGAKGKQKDA